MSSKTRSILFSLVAGASAALLLLAGRAAWRCWLAGPLLAGVPFGQAVHDREGRLLRLQLAADGRYRLYAPLEQISPQLVEATLLHEDRLFAVHPGFNAVALAKAAAESYLLGQPRRGGSTITMQLARLRWGIDSRHAGGKLLQILRALQLELGHSKQEILEAYLNLAPYGGNVEGVAAASLVYFGRSADRLSLAQALALSVIPQRPRHRGPDAVGHEPPDLLRARRGMAERWLAGHPAGRAEQLALLAPLRMQRRADLPHLAPHFVTRLLREESAAALVVADRPAPWQQLRTTLDLELQQLVERRSRSYVTRERQSGVSNVAVLLVDHRSMEVLAALGSVDFADAAIDGQVDGTAARRSPGSALKPFLYGLALDRGLIHPLSLLADTPQHFGSYRPENFDGEFQGPLSATEALVRSRNIPALSLADRLPGDGFYGWLEQAGIAGLRPAASYGLSLALGGAELTMEELVGLYAMLANHGVWRPLVRVAGGNPAELGGGATLLPAPRRLLSPEAAWLVLDMLRQNPPPGGGSGGDAARPRDAPDVAWKTGTSFGCRDAWAAGVVGPYVLAVWAGRFDGHGDPGLIGRKAAAPLLFDLIDGLRPRLPPAATDVRSPPAGLALSEVDVCPVSGQLAGPHCQHHRRGWFIPGVSPIDPCTVHREVAVDAASGLRACDDDHVRTRQEVYEIWPSDLARLFELAGIPRRLPPPWAPGCNPTRQAADGAAPRITSPLRTVSYAIRSGELGQATLPLTATSDADVRSLHWFLDGEYLGRVTRNEPLLWHLRPGRFVARVVDDAGRAAARPLLVSMVQ